MGLTSARRRLTWLLTGLLFCLSARAVHAQDSREPAPIPPQPSSWTQLAAPAGFTTWRKDINSGCSFSDHNLSLDIPADPADMSEISYSMSNYDVDYNSTGCSAGPEVDLMYFNGNSLGFLTGANDSWSVNSWPLTRAQVVKGANAIRIDTDAPGTGCWCVGVGYVEVRAKVGFKVKAKTPQKDDKNRDFHAGALDLTVSFSREYDASTLTASTFKLEYRDAGGSWQQVAGSFTQLAPERFRFVPGADLKDGVRYRATVKGGASGVKGKGGGELSADEVWYFHTVPDLSLTDAFNYGAGSVCPPTTAPCPGVELAVFQTARNKSMVPGGKAAMARVYLRWKLHTDVHKDDQVKEGEFEVALSVDGATQTLRRTVKRPDRYTAAERISASHTLNLKHTPSSAFSYSAEVTPQPQTNAAPVKYKQSLDLSSTGRSPTLSFGYYFLKEGAWKTGVPAASQAAGVALMTAGVRTITDQFPVLGATFNNQGPVSLGYTYTGRTLSDSTCGSVKEVNCPWFFTSVAMAEYMCVYDKLKDMRGGLFGIGADKFVATMVPVGICNGVTGVAIGGQVFMHVAGSSANDATIAHEVGHIYGISTANNPTRSHQGNSTQVEGFEVRTGVNRSHVENPTKAISLMHPQVQAPGAKWIENNDYVTLIGTVTSSLNRDAWLTFATAAGPYLRISGLIDEATGQVVFAPAFQQETPSDSPEPTGTCTVSLVDATGSVLADGSVTPGLRVEAEYEQGVVPAEDGTLQTGLQPFSISLPWFDTAQRVHVACGGVPLATLERSPRSPTVDFVGLADGSALSGTRLVSWSGADADGPNLAYQLQVSADGGASWTPVMPLSLASSLELDTAWLGSGPRKVRVLVTDGFNTAFASRSVSVSNALKVLGTLPASGAGEVDVGAPVSVTFATELDASSLSASSFRLTEPSGASVSGQVDYHRPTRTATFTPAAPLRAGVLYTGRLSSALRDVYGNALAAYTWSFTTAADRSAPVLVSSSPAEGLFDVPLDALVQARFDEPLRSPDASALTLTDSAGVAVSGTVERSADGRALVFVPSAPLQPDTEYTALVAGSVSDVAGNALGSPYAWSFTTGTEAAGQGFRIVGRYSDQAFDQNGDGLFERLSVSVDVEVRNPDSYNLNARLLDPQGTLLEWQSTGNVYLGRGVHTLVLSYGSVPIRSNGVDGPYTLDAVNLYGIYNPGVSDVRYDAYQTYPYEAAAFYSALSLRKLPNQLLEWSTTRDAAFNLRDYTAHATLPVTSVSYSVVINTDPRVGLGLGSDGTVSIRPQAGLELESDVVIRARDTLGNQVTSGFHISVQAPRPSSLVVPAEGSVYAGQPLTLEVAIHDQWERPLTQEVTVLFETTAGSLSPTSAVTGTGSASTVLTAGSQAGTAFVTTRVGLLSALTQVQVLPAPAVSRLYPIALHADTVRSAQVGQLLPNIWQGAGKGSFGWLSWTGDTSEAALAKSLTPPGDSKSYVNPEDPADHEVSVGDWIRSRPGVVDSATVRAALDALRGQRITVPVWSEASGAGDGTRYRAAGFACVQLTDYRLSTSGWISAVYVGAGPCP